MDDTLSDDEESELDTVSKKSTTKDKHSRKEESKKREIEDSSSESDSLTAIEELKIERKALQKLELLYPNCTPEEQQKENKKILEVLRNTAIQKKKIDSKERKIFKKKEAQKIEAQKKVELEAKDEKIRIENEEKRKAEELKRFANTVHHVVKDKVESVTEKLIDMVDVSRFLRDLNEKRQETLRKHQHSGQMLTRLRELLTLIRQATGDDEFNYKEVIGILQDLNGSQNK